MNSSKRNDAEYALAAKANDEFQDKRIQEGIRNVVNKIKTRDIPSIAKITVLFEKDKNGKNSIS